MRRLVATVVAGAIAVTTPVAPVRAQERVSLIRDTEVEAIIRTYGTPLWRAAGLEPSSVRVILVKDDRLNAFVAGGQNLFLNTGLLIKADSAGQVIGVMAHEAGHMAGGHLARMPEVIRNAMITSLIAMALSMGAGVGTRAGGNVGAGSVGIGASLAERNLFSFTRSQEQAADQAGVGYLEQLGMSARGLMQFMEQIQHQEVLSAVRQDPYLRTHPLTSERIEFLRNQVAQSRYSNVPVAPELEALQRRMRVKLSAFIDPPGKTLDVWAKGDSVEARYARAIAWYRIPDLKKALPEIDGLIRDFPKDPYFHELRGQMLFENGRIAEALPSYKEAVTLKPDAALIRIDYAHAQLETGDPALVPDAEANLNTAVRTEPELPELWRQLGVAYGRGGQLGMAAMALAEQALLEGRRFDARDQARRAMRLLPTGSPGWIKAQDVETQALRREE
ncbi:MAG: M48 family metallopeptidase [Alphaproteobacteria bacterium]|nr:M48 family metallopeptidase [Alphaproteobacteria bacterium]